MELLIGCGNNRDRKLTAAGERGWAKLVTLDMSPECKPDVVHDLEKLPLPFEDNMFDEAHAYDVLEHTGQQGNWRFFFDQFSDLWRILKPKGRLFILSPHERGPWAWGDPGHTRVLSKQCFTFLDQSQYAQVGRTAMTDYRPWYKADFQLIGYNEETHENRPVRFAAVLEAVKPARCAP